MAQIKYTMADGKDVLIEITDEFAVTYAEIDEQFRKNEEKFAWRQREREASYEKLHDESGFDIPDGTIHIEETVLSNDFIDRFLSFLTQRQKQVFRKVYIECKSLREVSTEMELSLHSIQKHVSLIKKKYLNFFSE